jgi:hypothetical protein
MMNFKMKSMIRKNKLLFIHYLEHYLYFNFKKISKDQEKEIKQKISDKLI